MAVKRVLGWLLTVILVITASVAPVGVQAHIGHRHEPVAAVSVLPCESAARDHVVGIEDGMAGLGHPDQPRADGPVHCGCACSHLTALPAATVPSAGRSITHARHRRPPDQAVAGIVPEALSEPPRPFA